MEKVREREKGICLNGRQGTVMFRGNTCSYITPLPPCTHSHREFAKSIPRPFSLHYNAYTQSVEVISDSGSLQKLVDDIKI